MSQEFSILNIVNGVTPVNFGIWNAALCTAELLSSEFQINSYLFASGPETWDDVRYDLKSTCVKASPQWPDLLAFLDANQLTHERTIIATHGCWSFPSRWGARLSTRGYRWIACPHGMLEPWSLKQKRIRKALYLSMRERPDLRKASIIRAVSSIERDNLQKLFPRAEVKLIPNGIDATTVANHQVKKCDIRRILFLGRFHEKKCPKELTLAFCQSSLANSSEYELVLAGPDEGERSKIEKIVTDFACTNIRVLDPIYGDDKQALIESATFFALPSQSEGFPTSVVEAMGAGCIPLISQGCNFPEASEAGLSFDCGTSAESIKLTLARLAELSSDELSSRGRQCSEFILANYTTRSIAKCFVDACNEL